MEPIIMDGDMDNIMDDRDTLCFDPSVLNASTPSLGRDFEDLFFRPSSAPQLSDAMSCLSPSEMPNKSQNDVPPAGSTPSDTRSDSPEDSSHSSSMDSPTGHLRNASLASNHSGLFSPDSAGTERYLPDWPNTEQLSLGEGAFLGQDSGSFSVRGDSVMDHDVEFSNKAMASAFDFDSAASSPSPLKMELNMEKSKPTVFKQSFRTPSTFSGQSSDAGSSQQQPAVVNPFVFQSSSDAKPIYPGQGFWDGRASQSSLEDAFGGIVFHPNVSIENYIRPRLIVHPTSLKSRVETQIPIKLTLYPMPPGVKKLRLPSHAISKPKFLAKPEIKRSPDILELRASVLCTSAIQDKKKRERAFARARGEDVSVKSPKDNSSEENQGDEDVPLGGAEVKICPGCIQRERKRASRKKQRKPEEDEMFQKDEDKRVIVFNTTEIKDWTDPPRTPNSTNCDPSLPIAPLGAMQVELPMRIACYCRHQNEKVGFQVLFTVFDYMDNPIAQAITNSIMITDDHKTHAPTNYTAAANAVVTDPQFPTAGVFAANPAIDLAKPFIHSMPYKLSHSANDLQALRNRQYPVTPAASNQSQNGTNAAAPVTTPRNLSRQASPSDGTGPLAKRRKQSGSGKVPTGLTMTRIETPRASQSPLLSNLPSANGNVDKAYVTPSMMTPQFVNGPPTPNNNDGMFFSPLEGTNSMDNHGQQTLVSAPSSTHPSRPGSPHMNNRNRSMDQGTPTGLPASGTQNHSWSVPTGLPPPQVPSMIHKLVPAEGSTTGGSEVTLLGSGFYPGMEVVFGDTLATTTTFWGEKCLNCLTPPSVKPGSVPVVFKHEHPRLGQHQPGQPIIPKPQIFFRYVDDRELQMYRIALGILGQKLSNPADAYQTAQQIMGGDGNSLWNLQNNYQGSGSAGGQQRQAAGSSQNANVTDTDAKMLVYLEFMDLDGSPGSPKYNSRSPSGQTLLHLASSLGLTRFVAGLLARGANPDVQDKNHNTPLHLAALSGHTHIVHRLRLAGANIAAPNLRGFTPADLATSLDAHRAVIVSSNHYRSRSVGSMSPMRHRPSSGSLDGFWEPTSSSDSADIAEDSTDDSDGEPAAEAPELLYAQPMRSKSESRKEKKLYLSLSRKASVPPAAILASAEPDVVAGVARNSSPPVALVAWRDQLAAQINQFQQNVNRAFPNLPNLPNLPNIPALPALPPMPTLPDYQTHPMIQRISSLVPHRPTTAWSTNIMKDGWDRLTGNSSPPAYEELYPHESDADYADKKSSMVEAALDAAADQHFAETDVSTRSQASSSKQEFGDVTIGRKNISREHQEQLRKAHAQKMKRFRSDRNLFIIWIPLLIIIVAAMLKNLIPDIWQNVSYGYDLVKSHFVTSPPNRNLMAT
ncbi:ankyrin repeat protein [Arthroderma uncinatum]|uniref:ankyrin repeat protein n=1 Tax=Arthroderma uncinatum TaxID=74035 RepID=UPI00144AEF88|nr:ankyrin repeat protein [Arthroderma uncinatum]KAF3491929.1 ankyrin repeat protein [Arthroderma uncinatum]